MNTDFLEFLVEESSMERFLRAVLPRFLPDGVSFDIHAFQGKDDLLDKLEGRLRGYAACLPESTRIIVCVDRDDDDCIELKRQMEDLTSRVGLVSRNRAGDRPWQIVNRICIEELEAWYFGDWPAVVSAYPRVSPTIPMKECYRNPDTIKGGTWEAFERILQRRGYFTAGLGKVTAAQLIGAEFVPSRCTSGSFKVFWDAVLEAVA